VPPTDFGLAGAVQREAGETPALCPQLWSRTTSASQEPALVRRPFPRPGPAAGRGLRCPQGRGDPSV